MLSHPARRLLGGVVAAVLVGSVALAAPAQASTGPYWARKLTKDVTLKGVQRHLTAFQAIANASGGNRASGQDGHRRSADYVSFLLRHAGYTVSRQQFQFNFCDDTGSTFAQTAPTATGYVDGTDYDVMECSGSGDVTGQVVPIDLALTPPRASTSGCEAADFPAAVAGRIALLQRGTCSFGVKVNNAQAAGAVGAIVMNQGNGDPAVDVARYALFFGTLGAPVGIPTVAVSYAQGEAFAGTAGLTVRIATTTVAEVRTSENVIAESRYGRADSVVMAGAHLDTEPDTAGINDNGSGSAALLEVALQMRHIRPKNKLRFAWWGAEESNLAGSTFHVANLTAAQRNQIALYLNFDMVGSPNYILSVFDGDDSAAEGAGPGPAGSAQIEAVFQRFFAARRLPVVPADFTGRSDYGPFIAAGVGIPAGGLFTGADGIKTPEQVAVYGGVAGVQYDPCYHAPCDSRTPLANGADPVLYAKLAAGRKLWGNINTFALDVNADAIATGVVTFAFDISTLPPRTPATAAVRAAATVADGSV